MKRSRKAKDTKKTSKKAKVEEKEPEIDESQEEEKEATKEVSKVPSSKLSKDDFIKQLAEEDSEAFWKTRTDDTPADLATKEKDYSFPSKQKGDIKIVSWNVAGLNATFKKGFLDYIQSEDPDVIVLSETKINSKNYAKPPFSNLLEKTHPYSKIVITETGQAGVAIFSKVKYENINTTLPDCDSASRFVCVEFPEFLLVNTYVPNASRQLVNMEKRMKWDAKFLKFMTTQKKPIIWTGDLNVANLWIDIYNPKAAYNKQAGFTVKERVNFRLLLNEGFYDVYRSFYPNRRSAYTYWSFMGGAKAKDNGWRLDYFVASTVLKNNIVACFRRPDVSISDHCPIGLIFRSK